MKCYYCKSSPATDSKTILHRINEKGVPGVWLCGACFDASRMKTKPRLGDQAFEVEWCFDLPVIAGTTDADMDNAQFHRVICPTLEQARALAEKVYLADKFGAVQITPVEFSDPHGDGIPQTFHWEVVGNTEEYSGKEAA